MTRGGKQIVRVTQKEVVPPANSQLDPRHPDRSATIAAIKGSQQFETLLQQVAFDFQEKLDAKVFEDDQLKKKYGAGHSKRASLATQIQKLRFRLAEVQEKLKQHRESNKYSSAPYYDAQQPAEILPIPNRQSDLLPKQHRKTRQWG